MNQPTQSQASDGRSLPADDAAHARQLMSAWADGEAASETSTQLWRDDPAARQAWHSYHLIGDVMRSDELASLPAHDAAFLQRLRTRLASEPVPITQAAKASKPSAPTTRRLAPVAAAAGVLLVAGVVLLNRPGASAGDAAAPAVATAPTSSLQRVGSAAQVATVGVDATGVIRNPQLDSRLQEYLRAHQATRGGLVAAVPGGSLRRVDAVVSLGNNP